MREEKELLLQSTAAGDVEEITVSRWPGVDGKCLRKQLGLSRRFNIVSWVCHSFLKACYICVALFSLYGEKQQQASAEASNAKANVS